MPDAMIVPLGGERRRDEGPAMSVPIDGGGEPGWAMDLRAPGACWVPGPDPGPWQHVVYLGTSRAVRDVDGSLVLVLNHCVRCRTALVSVGVSTSVASERRWYECVDPAIESSSAGKA